MGVILALNPNRGIERLKWLPPVAEQEDFQWKEGVINPPQNLQPKICLAYKMGRDKGRADTEERANQ